MKTTFEKSPESILNTLPINENYRIKHIETEITGRLIDVKRNFFEIGRSLTEAKQILPHGTFELWIEKKFGKELPYSTAYAYVKIYETFKDNPKTVQFIPITLLMSMSQKSFPKEILDIFNENAEYCDKLDLNTIKDAYNAFKEEKIDLAQFCSLAKKQIEMGISIEGGRTRQRITTNSRETLSLGTRQIIKAIKKVQGGVQQMQFLYSPIENSEEQTKLIREIDQTIQELQKLKIDLEGKKGLFHPITRQNPFLGVEYFSNLNSNN